MELPGWLGLDKCASCVKYGRQGAGVGAEGQEDQPQRPVFSDYCEHVQRKVQVASRLWGIRAADAARGTRASNETETRSRRSRQHGEVSLEVGLPLITDIYRWVNGQNLGILKLAIHRETRQRRAILQIPKSTIIGCHPNADGNLGKEVKDRLRTLLMIDHVNVLAMHEACEDSKSLYLVYDWPDGGLLLDFLTQYHEDVTEAHLAGVVREVLAALAAANRFHLHHLDWSLMCLFLSYKGRFSPLKLFGLGLAGFFVPLVTTRNTSKSRKHFYVSPELLIDKFASMNHKQLHACDIWSTGTLLYMLFSGRPPFCSSSTDEVCDKIRHGRWNFGHEFDVASRAAKDFIQTMMRKKWETRPQASELLKHSFMQLQVGQRRKEGVICQDALSKLDQFARETHCKQTLARLLADLGLQESQYSDLEDKFKQLDLDGNGVIEIPELWEVAGTLEGIDHDTIESIIATCDRNGNSTIDISEFVSAVVLKLENKDERLLVKAFDRMDMNRDARITKGEIFKVLRQYSGNLDAGDVSNFVSDLDKDADKKIDYHEFKYLFPHMKEKDEEIKSRLRNIKASRAEKKKQFRDLQQRVDGFMVNLRVAAGRLATEHDKLLKSDTLHGKVIIEKLQEVIDVIRAFAGKTQIVDGSKVDKEKKDRKQNMTGLSVMNQYKKEGEGTVQRTQSKGSVASNEHDVAAPVSETETAVATARAPPTALDLGSEDRPVAEAYVARGVQARGYTVQQLRDEANRRRRHLWMGGGEGVRHVRAAIMNRPQDLVLDRKPGGSPRSPRSNDSGSPRGSSPRGSSPRSARSGDSPRSARGRGWSPRSVGSPALASPASSVGPSARRSSAGKPGEQEKQADSDEEDKNFPIMPWTTKDKKLKLAQTAMSVASGQPVDKIGLLTFSECQAELGRISKTLFQEYRLQSSITSDLCDLHKLMRFKCARAWLPPLMLLRQEMEFTLDEQRASIHDRRAVFKDGIRFCLQSCERIMFSLTEFMLWQEEGFNAMWSLEDATAIPNCSKRFLPHRAGEEDADARTPRDEDDADCLAQGGVTEGLTQTRLETANLESQLMTKTISMAGLDDQPGTLPSLGMFPSQLDVSKSPRLDRNMVRVRKGKVDQSKLHSAVLQAGHEAAGGGTTLHFD